MIDRGQAFKLAAALNEKSWGYVSMRISKDEVSSVIWHPRQGMGLYERQLRDALALAQLHNLTVHIGVEGRQPEVRFTEREE